LGACTGHTLEFIAYRLEHALRLFRPTGLIRPTGSIRDALVDLFH
jgi:hypothetical protein